MGERQRKWARGKKKKLIELLGGKCSACGCDESLQMDCIEPAGDWHHRIEFSWRVSFYVSQMKNGNLQLLCPECHGVKSQKEMLKYRELPF